MTDFGDDIGEHVQSRMLAACNQAGEELTAELSQSIPGAAVRVDVDGDSYSVHLLDASGKPIDSSALPPGFDVQNLNDRVIQILQSQN